MAPVISSHLRAVLTKLEEAGCKLEIDGTCITITADHIRVVGVNRRLATRKIYPITLREKPVPRPDVLPVSKPVVRIGLLRRDAKVMTVAVVPSQQILNPQLEIAGGRRLSGVLKVSGANNSALVLMAASLLTEDQLRLRNMPPLTDIQGMAEILMSLGVNVR
ncbi:MAG: hypothetical protein ACKOCA_07360, partial [Vulcanococcus sp.]